MRRLASSFVAVLVLVLVLAAPALADDPAECRVAEPHVEVNFPLPHVSRAIATKRLDILVIGTGSSSLPGAAGVKNAYPAQLQSALSERLAGVAVKVSTDVKSRRTASEMLAPLKAALLADSPALVIWQTGTVDALSVLDIETFSAALEGGLSAAKTGGADMILMNAQFSPRTESMIAHGGYADSMRWATLRWGAPLFDRFGIMRLWSDLGTFQFYGAANKLDTARRVHDCIGRLLAGLVVEAARLAGSPSAEGR